jgi:hypothetical protein
VDLQRGEAKKKRGLFRRTKEKDGIEDVKKVVKQAKCAKTGMEAKVQCARGGGDQQKKRRKVKYGSPVAKATCGAQYLISSPAQMK